MNNKVDKIYEATIALISEKGVASNITIAEIANKALIGKGTIYEYFNTKEEVIAKSIIHLFKLNNIELNDIVTNSNSLDEAISKIIDYKMETYAKNNMISAFLIENSKIINKDFFNELNSEKNNFIKIFENLFKRFDIKITSFEINIVSQIIMMAIMDYTNCHKIKNKEGLKEELFNIVMKIIK